MTDEPTSKRRRRLLGALAGYDIVDLEVDEPPIEDVFMHFYGER